MNIGILKLGARLTWDNIDKTGGLGEAKAIIQLLTLNNTVNIYTDIKPKENKNPIKNIYIHNISEFEIIEDDVLLVFNGNVNFYAGVDSPSQTLNYKMINTFKGKVFYIWIDPELYLKQIWPSVEKKQWSVNYKKEEINIVRDDINVITSIYNVESAFQKVNKGKVSIKKENIFYFPFEKYPLVNNRKMSICKDLKYDLLYTGTFRSGRRQEKMIKFYFGHTQIKSSFIGKTEQEDFTKSYPTPVPEFFPAVKFEVIKHDINACVASVNIGDVYYEGNILTPRIYECILFSTVCLIDSGFDTQKRIFKNETLRNFNYVSTKKEVEDKILKLKNDPVFREEIITLQYAEINFIREDYTNQLLSLMK